MNSNTWAAPVIKMFKEPDNIFFKDFIYLFLERGKDGGERGRETSMCERNIN